MQTAFLEFILAFLAVVPALTSTTEAEIASQIPLPQLAANRFGILSQAEGRLVSAAADGKTADCTDLSGDGKNIRSDLLSWLCTNPNASVQLTHRGVSIFGAEIVNATDLGWARISFPIRVVKCVFRDAIDLSHSHIASLDLSGSSVQGLQAVATHSEGDLSLGDGFKTERGVNFLFAKIDGNFVCDGAEFINKDKGPALNANGVEVKGHLFLRNGFKADGEVNLVAAKIDGSLDCGGGQFISKWGAPALNGNSVEVKSSVYLRNGFKAEGEVNLLGAKIDGSLDCGGGQFISKWGAPALNGNSVEVKGKGVYLRNGFKAEGEVNLIGAKIDGTLECDGGQFIGKDKGRALNANRAVVKSSVYLRNGFKAEGEVNLIGAKIDGTLDCSSGQFINKWGEPALNADSAKIEGSVYLRNRFKAEGRIIFWGAYVGRAFQLFDVESPEKAILDLRLIRVGTLLNRRDSWPTETNLLVDGSIYDQIDDSTPPNAEVQLGWLERQSKDRFLSQPYEQLAAVFRKMGLEEDARAVMIAKNEEHARYLQWRPEWLWYGLFGHLIGYGYSPWRAFGISLIVILISWAAFRRGYCRGLVTPTGGTEYTMENGEAQPVSKDYPKFNAFVYSLETFVPLVKFGIADCWEPNGKRDAFFVEKSFLMTGGCLRGYMWFHMIAGWVLTALWVGGITGLVKT